jgi:hypothetical protein
VTVDIDPSILWVGFATAYGRKPMGFFDSFRKLKTSVPARSTVTFDDQEVVCRRPSGLVERVRWADLRIVFIETTDAGPAVDDVFWVLGGDESGCVVPSEAEGMSELLERLQRLPGFENQAVIEAMSCAENRTHLCWNRPNRSVGPKTDGP